MESNVHRAGTNTHNQWVRFFYLTHEKILLWSLNSYLDFKSFLGTVLNNVTTYCILLASAGVTIGTLRSDKGDVHKKTSLGKNRLSILSDHFAIIQVAQLLKRREFILETKRGDRARVQTKMVESIALPFPYSSKLKNWSFHAVVVHERQRNLQKSVMHVQICCFAH